MQTSRPDTERWERIVDWMDKPLVALAVLTMFFYLLDLLNFVDIDSPWLVYVTIFIDSVFVFDLGLKLYVYGTSYIQTPWFLIDLISCLPFLDAVANGVRPLRVIRFVRAFRILRILRGLRILRALRTIPAFDAFMDEGASRRGNNRLHHYMSMGLVGMTITVLVFIVVTRRQMETSHIDKIDREIKDGLTPSLLRTLGGTLVEPDGDNYIERTAKLDGRPMTVYFDLQPIDDLSDLIEFFVIIGMMLSMLFLMYIIAYHQLDVTQAQLRGLLNLALPKQVADQFVVDPGAYTKKSRMPATIVFMDFAGFTRTCEELAHDPDLLSKHLEQAMDRVVGELVKHDVIIDKFIGDAIMSFRGGPLVTGNPAEHAYRVVRATLASTKALADLDDPYFHNVKIGGASGDDCLIGAFGTSGRLSYTILGDAVNLAARLEPASAQCGTSNLFCEYTHKLCNDRDDILWRRWGRIRVVGKSAPLKVYEAFDRDEHGEGEFIKTFHSALEAFEAQEYVKARELFLVADSQRPRGDASSQGYIRWCDRLLSGDHPVGAAPVFDTHK
ncbi:ion transporter [Singulisphaera sp. PoT]|uniref:ion transporter n=1 Tax=Singulisphaera sp. PoT TaxID=3411797 RepID=UPI003BF60D76